VEPIPTTAVKHVLLLGILVLLWGHPRLYPRTWTIVSVLTAIQ
jgi:hypothetical protein